jgi:hypothetical protein
MIPKISLSLVGPNTWCDHDQACMKFVADVDVASGFVVAEQYPDEVYIPFERSWQRVWIASPTRPIIELTVSRREAMYKLQHASHSIIFGPSLSYTVSGPGVVRGSGFV